MKTRKHVWFGATCAGILLALLLLQRRNPSSPASLNHTGHEHSSQVGQTLMRQLRDNQLGTVEYNGETARLVVHGAVVFEARDFGYRSISDSGTIALSAVTGDKKPVSRADVATDLVDGKLIASPGQIWLLEKGREPRVLSPPSCDAWNPVISKDGKKIAYTGWILGASGFPIKQALFILSVDTGEVREFESTNNVDHHTITAVDWQPDRTLRYVTTHGENGGNQKVAYLKP